MLTCEVRNISRLTIAQKGTQRLPCALITFCSAGQTRITVGSVTKNDSEPYLALMPTGTEIYFEYSAKREQWGILLDLPALLADDKPGAVGIADEVAGGSVTVPMFTPIGTEHVASWDREFMRLREAFQAPCPANRIRLRTGISNVIRYVIDQRPTLHPSPAAKLRWLIDEDQEMSRSLEELSRQCGYSASRLRVLFEKEYAQSPQAYRNTRRMSLAVDLLCNSDQRIKEISKRVGCRHVSHFSALFKTAFGQTPREYRSQFRQL